MPGQSKEAPFQALDYYHPDQHGSASIKAVLPVLTGHTYADLEIREGGQASLEYLRVHSSDAPEAERSKVREHLERYLRPGYGGDDLDH